VISRLVVGPLVVLGLIGASPRTAPAQGASYEQLQTFSSLINQIRLSYVDSVTYAELVHAAIDGVLGSLDPHSRFMRRADGARELAYESGAVGGSGISFDEVDGRLTVLTVYPGSPGARSGIAAGDRLVTINDTSAAELSASDATRRLFGEKGRKVRLVFVRGTQLSPDTLRVNVKLDLLKPVSVTVARLADPTTGYVRVVEFLPKAAEELERATRDLRGKGAKRLILDLRGNPGGVVGAAVDMAGLFLPKKTVVFKIEGRRRSNDASIYTDGDGPFRELPLMVLVDGSSASASEAVAGSLQDHDRALVLGHRTFGKALMQQLFQLPPQGDMVWLTVGRIATPSGRVIQRSYRGLKAAQYYSFAGVSGAEQDTLGTFRTAGGRTVRGGGGIVPDVELAHSAVLPAWFSVAADSGWIEAIADSVAVLLPKEPAGRTAWLGATAEWQSRLTEPFVARAQARISGATPPDAAVLARIGRILGHRATEVRWGPDAADEFLVRNDPELIAAMTHWNRLAELPGAPK